MRSGTLTDVTTENSLCCVLALILSNISSTPMCGIFATVWRYSHGYARAVGVLSSDMSHAQRLAARACGHNVEDSFVQGS